MSKEQTKRSVSEGDDADDTAAAAADDKCVACHRRFPFHALENWNDHAFCHGCAVLYGLTLDDDESECWEEYRTYYLDEMHGDVDFQAFCTETPPLDIQSLPYRADATPALADLSGGSQENLLAEPFQGYGGEDDDSAGIFVADEEVGFLLLLKRLYQLCGGMVPFSFLCLAAERKGLHQSEWAQQHHLSSGMHVVYELEMKGYIDRTANESCYKLSDMGESVITEYINYLAVRPEVQPTVYASGSSSAESIRSFVMTPACLSSVIAQKMRRKGKRE